MRGANREPALRRPPCGATALATGLIALPLAGAWLAGREWRGVFRFPPPLELPADYPRFSWFAAGAVLAALTSLVVAWIVGACRRQVSSPEPARGRGPAADFPWWGWAALGWTLAWWAVAWTRLPGLAEVQRFTFFPLWLGFIVTVNALTWRLAGTCLMRRDPRGWLVLFGASALFWWVFEWLNRFVRNWHYLGVEDFGAAAYALHATVCFSTVLPAVAAVAEWLEAHAGWRSVFTAGPEWRWLASRRAAACLVVGGAAGLLLTGAYPTFGYPALWVAPLAWLLARSIFTAEPGVVRGLVGGDWSRAAAWMLAALICGFFWELWNWHSLARWIYTVPGVERWHVFEMPLPGYAGYLPFGLECLLVVEWLRSRLPNDGR